MTKKLLFTAILFFNTAIASNKPFKGFIDFNYYYDSRDFNTFTQNILANINHKVQYFSFVNFTNQENSNDNLDKNTYFSEQNLRFKISNNCPFEATGQWVIASGDKNDIFRIGLRASIHQFDKLKDFFSQLGLMYWINIHPLQIDSISGFNWQIEHTYSVNLYNQRIYLFGFIDQNILVDAKDKVVMEHQLGYRIVDEFYAVIEYRWNEFLPQTKNGIGYGLEYKLVF